MIDMQQYISKTFKFRLDASANEFKCKVKVELYCPQVTKNTVGVMANDIEAFIERNKDVCDIIRLSELLKENLKRVVPTNVMHISLIEDNGFGIDFGV